MPRILGLERATAEAPHWSEAVYRECVVDEANGLRRKVLLVAMSEEGLQGFAAASLVEDEAELESIAVDAGARRSGLGRELLEALKQWARSHGAVTLRLEVRSANASAQTFYRSQGFVREGLRRAYYQAPADDAVLLRLDLLPANSAGETARGREL